MLSLRQENKVQVSPDVLKFAESILISFSPVLKENDRRLFYGIVADNLGFGGASFVAEVTGASRNTVASGIDDIDKPRDGRIRKKGGGRKSEAEKNCELLEKVEDTVRESTYGNPMDPLTWTTLSLREISEKLKKRYCIDVSHTTVGTLLEMLGYSKQKNQKMLQVGKEHPNRDKQFRHINATASEFLEKWLPVISVDTKKKELLGGFGNPGREYRRVGDPGRTPDHDFEIKELGKVVPYGVYVVNDNTGFVNLGTDNDTAEFASESILQWWQHIGSETFPDADKIYITCDGGGSNSSRTWLWKANLQRLADETGLEIHVSHFPPGTSKWNKIEHRLFCCISKNWEGKPLYDIETAVNLIGSTTTKKGLTVKCVVDERKYEKGLKVSDAEKAQINITFVNDMPWNYIIRPSS